MIKKLVLFVLLFVIAHSLVGYSFSRRCKKCVESAKKNKRCYPEIGIATRDFGTPIVHKDGKAYAMYKCQYGHVYLVPLD